jgi:hypothetical protein
MSNVLRASGSPLVALLLGSYAGTVMARFGGAAKRSPFGETTTDKPKDQARAEGEDHGNGAFRAADRSHAAVDDRHGFEGTARAMTNIQTILDDAPGISMQRSGALDAQLSARSPARSTREWLCL